ncbi:hypothetical protein CIT292_09419 [Citrobacter youngae ATCC 29220]|uniref:Uncharacterized protein n=1 Tax=Citrobacter youngae ATCC 29220 TaxID=500640 RepID=D4BF53_9ENTR|nr:hypothetical protein CIT292_09419 [Citrobacter youngae ATCC 29220]
MYCYFVQPFGVKRCAHPSLFNKGRYSQDAFCISSVNKGV